jgi:hypothetical protein
MDYLMLLKGKGRMTYFIVAIVLFIGVISLVGTLIAGRQVDHTIQTLNEASPEREEDLLKAHHFKSHQSNFGVLTLIYVVMFIVVILAAVIYFIVR